MKFRPSYLVIPLITITFAAIGTLFTTADSTWYAELVKPLFNPPGSVFGPVWTLLYILTAIAAVRFWNAKPRDGQFKITVAVFLANGVLNAAWSYIFFTAHLLGLAVLGSAMLGASVLWLIVLLWNRHRVSAYLLIPYLAWVSFATFLAYSIWALNK